MEQYLRSRQKNGEVVTGLLYVDESVPDLHEMNQTPETPLVDIPFGNLCPGAAALDELQEEYR